MKPIAKKFTKQNPCDKRVLWNSFRGKRGFKRVQKDISHSEIGMNAPRNMLSKGYLELCEKDQSEYYILTEKGEEWITKGVVAFVKNHPNMAKKVINLPKSLVPIKP